jgi:hypothetical protein
MMVPKKKGMQTKKRMTMKKKKKKKVPRPMTPKAFCKDSTWRFDSRRTVSQISKARNLYEEDDAHSAQGCSYGICEDDGDGGCRRPDSRNGNGSCRLDL